MSEETVSVESPAYYVEMPQGMPDLIYGSDEYGRAFEHATGERMGNNPDGHDDESKIHVWEFEGQMEVPIANV